jgi:hypothetical protein
VLLLLLSESWALKNVQCFKSDYLSVIAGGNDKPERMKWYKPNAQNEGYMVCNGSEKRV